ncbi:hypothetical protein Dimus_009692 [Dionaea muscipula]
MANSSVDSSRSSTFHGPSQIKSAGLSLRPSPVIEEPSIQELIKALEDDAKRDLALHLLCKIQNKPKNFASALWFSLNTVWIILKEITEIYRPMSAEILTMEQSNRLCNAITLLQYMAADPVTRPPFIKAKVVGYLFPFLNLENTSKPYEYLRLSSLGVVGALVKSDDSEIICDLLDMEGFRLFLRCLEIGDFLSKTNVPGLINVNAVELNQYHFSQCSTARDALAMCLPTRFSSPVIAYVLQVVARCWDCHGWFKWEAYDGGDSEAHLSSEFAPIEVVSDALVKVAPDAALRIDGGRLKANLLCVSSLPSLAGPGDERADEGADDDGYYYNNIDTTTNYKPTANSISSSSSAAGGGGGKRMKIKGRRRQKKPSQESWLLSSLVLDDDTASSRPLFSNIKVKQESIKVSFVDDCSSTQAFSTTADHFQDQDTRERSAAIIFHFQESASFGFLHQHD